MEKPHKVKYVDHLQPQWPIKKLKTKNNNFQITCSTHIVSSLLRHRPWRGRIHANELQVNNK